MMTNENLAELIKDRLKGNDHIKKVVLDLGCGDGRFPYKTSLEQPDSLVVGVDPASNFRDYQRLINRKKLSNTILVQKGIETLTLPQNTFNEIYITLPWGTLLKYAVSKDLDFYKTLEQSLKVGGFIQVLFGFHTEFEKTQTQRLEITDLTEEEMGFLKDFLSKIPSLSLSYFKTLDREDLKQFETTWAKKLTHGQSRKYYLFKLIKI